MQPTSNTSGNSSGHSVSVGSNYYDLYRPAPISVGGFQYFYHDPHMAKIKLKLSEIEKLRDATRAYPEIKEILEKFLDYIEIIPDFD